MKTVKILSIKANKLFRIIMAIAIWISISSISSAQVGSMGNSMPNFGLNARNLNAVNPALLFYDSVGVFVSLPTFAAAGANNNMSIDDINYYFGNKESKYLTKSDKQKILSTFDNDGRYYTKINASVAKLFLSFGKIGTFGFEMNDYFSGNLILPKQFVELALNGNELNRKYTFDDLNVKSWWVRNYAINYANQVYKRSSESSSSIEALNVGAKFKYIQGFAYAGTESIKSSFYTNQNDNSLKGAYKVIARTAFSNDLGVDYDFDSTYVPIENYNPFPESVGSGFGIDLGFNMIFRNGINFSLALNDLGSITWDKHAVEHTMTGEFFVNDIFNQDQLDSLIDMNQDDSKYISEFSISLPANLQAGLSLDIAKHIKPFDKWIWFANYSQGLNSTPGNSVKPIIEVGNYVYFGNWIPSALVALRYDETESIRVPLMISYPMGVFSIGFNTLDMLSLFSSSTKKPHFSAGLNMSLQFK